MNEANALDFACGNVRYIIKKSLFSSKAVVLTGNIERPYCVSDTPAEKTADLVIKDTEIWCIEKFYISMDRQPYAKSSKLLNFSLNQLVEYEYVWQGGGWRKTDTRITKCPLKKQTKRQKVPDQK